MHFSEIFREQKVNSNEIRRPIGTVQAEYNCVGILSIFVLSIYTSAETPFTRSK